MKPLFFLGLCIFAAQANIEVTFQNFGLEAMEVFWMGDDGPHKVGDLAPGAATLTILSFAGHTFEVQKANHMAKKAEGSFVVSELATFFSVGLPAGDIIRVECGLRKQGTHILRIEVHPDWSPHGAGRFLELVAAGYFDGVAMNRVVPRFLSQFGIGAIAETRKEWSRNTIPDDPSKGVPFRPGTMAFAGSGPNSRTTEMFFVMPGTPSSQLTHFGVNPWETPFAQLFDEASLNEVGGFHSYGDMPPWGSGPEPQKVHSQGYEYLAREFPDLDYFDYCRVLDESITGAWDTGDEEL